jgi:hypothetical protein
MTDNETVKVFLGEKLKDRVAEHNYKFRKDKTRKINVSKVCRIAVENELEVKGAAKDRERQTVQSSD